MRPSDHIGAAIAGHAEVLDAVRRLSDRALQGPSLLPGWTRASVIAHLAHKSRSPVNVFAGARTGEVRSQYPDGQAAADAETLAWSQLPAQELCRQLADSFASLEASWAALANDGWSQRGTSSAGTRTMIEFVDRHMRDLFVHYVDIDVGYQPADWPAIFVSTELPKRLRDLPERTKPASLLAWLLGRSPSPELGPW